MTNSTLHATESAIKPLYAIERIDPQGRCAVYFFPQAGGLVRINEFATHAMAQRAIAGYVAAYISARAIGGYRWSLCNRLFSGLFL